MFGDPKGDWYKVVNWVTFFIFLLDIIFNCCRQYRDIDGILVKEHKQIVYKYFRSGQMIIDILATIPFHFFNINKQAGNLIKLLRLFRLSRIWSFYDSGEFKEIVDNLNLGNTGSTRITSKRWIQKIYSMLRIIFI